VIRLVTKPDDLRNLSLSHKAFGRLAIDDELLHFDKLEEKVLTKEILNSSRLEVQRKNDIAILL
jgi:hypothetical protein